MKLLLFFLLVLLVIGGGMMAQPHIEIIKPDLNLP
jgi:hypothetical protein